MPPGLSVEASQAQLEIVVDADSPESPSHERLDDVWDGEIIRNWRKLGKSILARRDHPHAGGATAM